MKNNNIKNYTNNKNYGYGCLVFLVALVVLLLFGFIYILTLYYYSGYTTKEIGHIMNKNENTIKTKIRRAKDKLRKEYGGELYERN